MLKRSTTSSKPDLEKILQVKRIQQTASLDVTNLETLNPQLQMNQNVFLFFCPFDQQMERL